MGIFLSSSGEFRPLPQFWRVESEDNPFIRYASRQQIRSDDAFSQAVFDLELASQQPHVKAQVTHTLPLATIQFCHAALRAFRTGTNRISKR